MTGVTKANFLKILVYFLVNTKKNEDSTTYEQTLLKGNIDICKVSKGIFSSFLVKAIVERIVDHSNVVSLECPWKKGYYYAVNVPVGKGKSLPYHLIGLTKEFEVSVIVKVKLSKATPLVHLFSLKVYGVYKP